MDESYSGVVEQGLVEVAFPERAPVETELTGHDTDGANGHSG